jgi:hypothetical protein
MEHPYHSFLNGGVNPAPSMAGSEAQLGSHDGVRSPYAGHPAPVWKPTPSLATISFVFGLLAICFTPPFLSAIIALVTGVLARREIQRSNGHLSGGRQALTGLILGSVSLALSLAGLTLYVLIWLINISMETSRL